MDSIDGAVWSFSQFRTTVQDLTPSHSAACFWVSHSFSRRFLTYSPGAFGSNCVSFGFNALRVISANCSRAARAYHRVPKLASTIADLAKSEAISVAHVAEAIQYRKLDRRAH